MDQRSENQQIDPISTTDTQRNLDVMLAPFLRILWNMRHKIVIINGVMSGVTLLILFIFVKPYFDSTITILPEYGSKTPNLGSLGNLAAMAGFSVGDGSSTADIYEHILMSETVIEPVIHARYYSKEFKDSVNLIEFFKIEPDDELPEILRERKKFLDAYTILAKSVITISVDIETKILSLNVRMPESQLSSSIANNLVLSLDEYVRTKRKTNASVQRLYIEKRVKEVQDSMDVAENNLKTFLMGNRAISQSPELVLEQTKLNRQVQILQSVYIELMRQFEIVKIDELRDAPIVNVKEWTKDPIIKSGPSRLRILLLVMIISVFITITYYLFRDNVSKFFRGLIKNVVVLKNE